MPGYVVQARPHARRSLGQLNPLARMDVLAVLRTLADNPRPAGAAILRGYRPWLRIRAGDYRMLYAVDDAARVVTVAVVGHRREVYRSLDL